MKKLNVLFFLIFFFYSSNARDSLQQQLFDLGKLYFDKAETFGHNYDSCIYYTQLAQPLFKKAEAWEYYVFCDLGLSTIYFYKGDFEKYKSNLDSALNTTLKFLGTDSKAYGYVSNNMGVLYNRKGDYDNAIELYKKSLDLQLKSDQPKKYLARTYNNLAKVFWMKHDYWESLKYSKKAFSFRQASGQKINSSFANDLLSLGECFDILHQPDSAIFYFNRSLQLLDQIPKEKRHLSKRVSIRVHQKLAKLFLLEDQPEKAFTFIQKAFSYQKASDAFNKDVSYNLLGKYYLAQDEIEKALGAFDKAKLFFKKNNPHTPKHRKLEKIDQLIANTYFDLQDYPNALTNYQAALQKVATNFDIDDPAINPEQKNITLKGDAIELLNKKAATLMKMSAQDNNNLDFDKQAFNCHQLAKKLIVELRQDFLATGSKYLLAEKVGIIYETAIGNALKLYQSTGDERYLKDAFNSFENNKAILLLESLNEDLAKKAAGIPDSLLTNEHDLTIDLAFYEKTINLEKQKGDNADQEKIKKWELQLFELQEKYQKITQYLETEFPRYYELKYTNRNVTIADVQKALPADGAFLEYFVGKEQSFLILIQKNATHISPLNLNSETFESIHHLRKLISQVPDYKTGNVDFENFLLHANNLYQALIGPVESKIKDCKQLIIVPDDLLGYIPFEILLSKKEVSTKIDYSASQRSYLLKKYTLSYDYSASLWLMNLHNNDGEYLKVFGGFAPTFQNRIASDNRSCNSDQLYSLKCSQQEVEGIQQTIGGDIFSGIEASKKHFLEDANAYQIIHLATHACINEENAMLNKIHFTDDFLSNYDLSTLNLNAELAVLSACNTGTGKLLKGEGMMSLARNFTQAGCQSTVMSLWPVNDCSTSSIMNYFYKNLAKGQNKKLALRDARLTYLETTNKLERHPYYWAAFVQFGNSKALNFHQPFPFKKGFYALVGIIILFSLFKVIKKS